MAIRKMFLLAFCILWLLTCCAAPSGFDDKTVESTFESTGGDPKPDPDAYLRPGPTGDGHIILPNGRFIYPVGDSVTVTRFPIDIEITPDGQTAIVNTIRGHTMTVVDLTSHTEAQVDPLSYMFYGIAINATGDKFWVAGGGSHKVYEYDLVGQTAIPAREIELVGYPSGLTLSPDETTLFVTCHQSNKVSAVDLGSGLETGFAKTQIYPYGIELLASADRLYVSNWGSSSVSVLGTNPMMTMDHIPVGKNPEGLALSPDGSRLYVANSDSDSISVIDTAGNDVIATYNLYDEEDLTLGASPTAVEISSDGSTLYVTAAGYNSIDVLDAATGEVKGRIPASWYPTDLVLDEPHGMLYVANGKGRTVGSGAEKESIFLNGTIAAIPIPTPTELAEYTEIVLENNMRTTTFYEDLEGFDSPIPFERGQPSQQIKHVVYVLKENKTYDSVLGDLEGTEADPSFLQFGEFYTPNTHELARDFVVCDNFYNESEVSIQGHMWGTASICNDYVEKCWLAEGRAGPLAGVEEAGKTERGFIFHNCLRNGVDFRTYGQIVGVGSEMDTFAPYIDFKYGFWNLGVSDEIKVDEIIREMEGGFFPSFVYISLPNDHTEGTSSGKPVPQWYVGDNDAALGKLIDYISHSEYWNETVIFVTEDDPQSAGDHIEPHRTIGLVISPWAKRGHVSSVLYSMSSMWMTIELILGLPPMHKYDQYTAPMYDCFSMTPDFTPYDALPNRVPLEYNEKGAPLQEYCDQANWMAPDQVSRLGEVIWAVMRPGEPFPYNFSVDSPEELEEEAEEAREYIEAIARAKAWALAHGISVGLEK